VRGTHYYLISSLPLLRLGETPFYGSDAFIDLCLSQLSARAFAAIASVTLAPNPSPSCAAEEQWAHRETCVRNCVARHRAAAMGVDAERWLRPEPDVWPSLQREVDEALSQDDPLRRQRALDEVRWRQLDDIVQGHQFSFGALVVYKLRLALVERSLETGSEQGRKLLEALTESARRKAEEQRVLVEIA
jgi:hypothetical protein